MTQSLFNWNYIQKERGRREPGAAQYSYQEARELVVLVAGNAYLQAIAGAARVETAEAQVRTAQTLYDRAVDQQKAGVIPAIDALRAHVELQSRQQQLISTRNDFAKQKLTLGRVIGLPLGQEFTLTDKAPYDVLVPPTLDEALKRAFASRPDYQAALAQARSAELSRSAATAEHYPSLDMESDYGVIGVNPATPRHVPCRRYDQYPDFEGGKVHADVLKRQRSVRPKHWPTCAARSTTTSAMRFSTLNAAADQVQVARSSVDLAEQTLAQARIVSRRRFHNLEVVQAQESVASAHEDYISVFTLTICQGRTGQISR